MLDGSWVSEGRSLLLHIIDTPWWPTRPNGLMATLALASTRAPSRNASLISLFVGVPLGSSANADSSTPSHGKATMPPPYAEIGTRAPASGKTRAPFRNCVR